MVLRDEKIEGGGEGEEWRKLASFVGDRRKNPFLIESE